MIAHEWSFADAFVWSCSRHAGRVAWTQGDDSATYEQLLERSSMLAGLMHSVAGPGDRVAVLARNSSWYLAAFGAAARVRATLVPLNPRLSMDELSFIIDDSGAVALLTDTDNAYAAAALCERTGVRSLALDRPGSERPCDDHVACEDDLLALMYTAAVDGRPRGAMMPQRAFSFQMANMADALGLTPNDRFAVFTPMCHAAAVTYALACLHVGATCVSLSAFDPIAAARAIEHERVTIFPAFAPMPQGVLDAAERETIDLRSLRCVIARDSAETIERFFAAVPGLEWQIGNFGQTETQGMAVAGVRLNETAYASGAPVGGRPLPMTRVRVVDAAGEDVADGSVGEIVVKGPNTALGYWQREAESAHARRDGWWHTGDLGRFDEHGLLQFAGRTSEKDLIKSGGENVYPEEVESVLKRHPAVRDAAVIGVPDPRWTEAVRAVVVLVAGQAIDADELIEFCRDAIAPYKKPRSIAFVDALPRLPDGALDRAAIRTEHGGVEAGHV